MLSEFKKVLLLKWYFVILQYLREIKSVAKNVSTIQVPRFTSIVPIRAIGRKLFHVGVCTSYCCTRAGKKILGIATAIKISLKSTAEGEVKIV